MIWRRSHDQLSKNWFPDIPMSLITNVNKRVDNPTPADIFMNNTLKNQWKSKGLVKNPYDLFQLTTQGHRSRNHDFMSGMFMGAVQAQKQGLPQSFGIRAAIAHQMQDYVSNALVRRFGPEGRNVIEALMLNSMVKRRQWY